jgi:hypothetical protein
MIRQGGPFAMRETERARRAMEAAAAALPALPAPAPGSPTLHLLTGRSFWYQTAFCLHSFVRASGVPVRAEIYDDGTIEADVRERLVSLGPAVRIRPLAQTIERIDEYLPASRFPVLHERWLNYPNIRKLIDVHAGSSGWKLVIDSDLLFFRRPALLLDWLAVPGGLLHAVDCEESYGYSRALMRELCGRPVPPKVNVGLAGLDSSVLEWEELEHWCRVLQQRERTSYYLEQALVAMLAARDENRCVAPAAEYITGPSRSQVEQGAGVMHHYVAETKRWYFRDGWRHVMRAA